MADIILVRSFTQGENKRLVSLIENKKLSQVLEFSEYVFKFQNSF